MSIESHAADEARKQTAPDRYETLAEDLRTLADVANVAVEAERLPPRLMVTLDAANVTPAVADRLDEYHGEIVPESVEVTATGDLRFEVLTPELFKPAGSRETRAYGPHSTAWTFTSGAVELTGFDENTMLDAYARDGALLLVRRDD